MRASNHYISERIVLLISIIRWVSNNFSSWIQEMIPLKLSSRTITLWKWLHLSLEIMNSLISENWCDNNTEHERIFASYCFVVYQWIRKLHGVIQHRLCNSISIAENVNLSFFERKFSIPSSLLCINENDKRLFYFHDFSPWIKLTRMDTFYRNWIQDENVSLLRGGSWEKGEFYDKITTKTTKMQKRGRQGR